MDGMLGQWTTHLSVLKNVDNLVPDLERAVTSLLQCFAHRNEGRPPKRIIVYREGVAENAFDDIVEKELVAFKNAFYARGYDDASIKLAIIVCHKRHHIRLLYEGGSGNSSDGTPSKGNFEYLNPCVGLCVDARCSSGVADMDALDAVGSITAPNMNEFYINAHAAVLGTSKPCKYDLIYDEIGLEVSGLYLLFSFNSVLILVPTFFISSVLSHFFSLAC
jgi:eukaryotic translation initiation factor 2C